jgi:thiamine biosynthesis lipoprotein
MMTLDRSHAAVDALLGRRRLLLGGAAAVALGACGRRPAPAAGGGLHLNGMSMASTYNVKLARDDADAARVQAAVQEALDEVDARMSLFRADSELARLNRHRAGAPLALSPELHEVLAAAHAVSAWSDGAFDVTVAPLVQAWGFGTEKRRVLPPSTQVQAERERVGWRGLQLDARAPSATKARADLQADLGGIAKGYGVDRAAQALDALGIADYMVELGGEVRTRGRNAAGQPWRIGIEQPDAPTPRPRWIVPLSGRAMATSGDYRQYFEHDGRRYSHEIDPARGVPIGHTLCSVTVVAADCMRADALATALIVLGAERGRVLAESAGIAAQFIERGADGGLRDSMTAAFAALAPLRA